MKKPTLSLCMIVKNEEEVLARCLESVKDVVDEMIIVDTGSTDKTKEIAESFGAKIYDFKWIEDFAAARNFAKSKATKEWIIQLDADEYIVDGEASKIKEEIIKQPVLSMTLQIINLKDGKPFGYTHHPIRMIKNDKNIEYRYKIHEQPMHKKKSMLSSCHSSIRVFHTGYETEVVAKKNKRERNLNILKKELERNPNDSFINYNLANEYLTVDKYEEAIHHYKKALRMKQYPALEPIIRMRMVMTYFQIEKYEEGLKLIVESKKKYPDYPDLYYYEAIILQKLGREFDSIEVYKTCLKQKFNLKKYMTQNGINDKLPLQQLAFLYTKHRKFKEAVEILSKLIKLDKFNETFICSLISILELQSSDTEIINFLDKIYQSVVPKELVFKLNISFLLKKEKMFINYYEKIMDKIGTLDNNLYQAYYYLCKDKFNIAKHFIDKLENEETLKFIYYIKTKDESIKDNLEINETYRAIINVIEKNEVKNCTNLEAEKYIEILNNLVRSKEFRIAENVLLLEEKFDNFIYKQIGDLFFGLYNDEFAIQYYLKYLNSNDNDDMINLKLAEMLFSVGSYEDAIMFADKTLAINNGNFRPVEIILESFKKLGNVEAVKGLTENFLQSIPDSKYLLSLR